MVIMYTKKRGVGFRGEEVQSSRRSAAWLICDSPFSSQRAEGTGPGSLRGCGPRDAPSIVGWELTVALKRV